MDIGKTVKELRMVQGISLKELAKALDITPAALWKIENGRVVPKNSTIEKVCKQFHIPLAYFYHKSMTIEDYLSE